MWQCTGLILVLERLRQDCHMISALQVFQGHSRVFSLNSLSTEHSCVPSPLPRTWE